MTLDVIRWGPIEGMDKRHLYTSTKEHNFFFPFIWKDTKKHNLNARILMEQQEPSYHLMLLVFATWKFGILHSKGLEEIEMKEERRQGKLEIRLPFY